ncbi:ORF170 [White spot syndrome virus]|uniref:ORF170 n=1 Tax=White spot syndrome virus TaxID=342409 RepID=A0A2D3I6L6_9VIRU|nr:ORF170 [White spot syndrome virus]
MNIGVLAVSWFNGMDHLTSIIQEFCLFSVQKRCASANCPVVEDKSRSRYGCFAISVRSVSNREVGRI